jgi:hypothetical protein
VGLPEVRINRDPVVAKMQGSWVGGRNTLCLEVANLIEINVVVGVKMASEPDIEGKRRSWQAFFRRDL